MTNTGQGSPIISAAGQSESGSTEGFEDPEVPDSELRELRVPVEAHGARLDLTMVRLVPEFSRNYLQQLISAGAVVLNGVPATKPSARVKALDVLGIELKPTAQSQAFKPEAMELEIVFEDEFLLVVNKRAGLVVHPAPGNWTGTLLNGLLARDPAAAMLPRAGIVHRLDKDTSGLMVVARQRLVMDRLVEMIAARSVSRHYIALAHGLWRAKGSLHVDFPVGRDPKNRLRMAVVDMHRNPGKTAATDITLLDGSSHYCLVECKLQTGRTHQIRVHMAALGLPLVSDNVYGGGKAAGLNRQALHARRLAFKHPVTAEAMEFVSSPPADITAAIASMGLRYN